MRRRAEAGAAAILKKVLVHCAALVVCGVCATFVVAWSTGGYGILSRGPNDLILNRYGVAVPIMHGKIMAGDKGWARVVAVDSATTPPTAYHGAEGDAGHGGLAGNVYRFPLNATVTDELLRSGAVQGTERTESVSGLPPRSIVRQASQLGKPDQFVAVFYWGRVLPLVRCEMIFSEKGTVIETSGLVRLDGGRFLPFAPVWPGFGVSVLLLGSLCWGTLYGVGFLIKRQAVRVYRRHRPLPPVTVACPKCGYTRSGLASIDACPECGSAGPVG